VLPLFACLTFDLHLVLDNELFFHTKSYLKMKLSPNTNALNFLEENDPVTYSTPDNNEELSRVRNFIDDEFVNLRPLFLKKVQYITDPFFKAFTKGRSKLEDILTDVSFDQSGTYVIPVKEGTNNTVFYNLKAERAKSDWKLNGTIMYFAKSKKMPEPYLFVFIHIQDNKSIVYLQDQMWKENRSPTDFISPILYMILFTQYCEVETKIVPAGRNDVHLKEKYVNETKRAIEILDSTWFTTIIKTDGFWVGKKDGGILRWQHYGPGRTMKKIVFIYPFEKQGYVRKAKVIDSQ